ncbi:MAG: DUF1667 domain-containing protein [Clostridiaceae bacterium]|nr:DUF1667 domain-containing protein [Clostridiaceae bacterium]
MIENITCTGCPMGCRLSVEVKETENGPEILDITGYECNRGRSYAQDEVIRPRRMITTLIRTGRGKRPLSVRSSEAIPKDLIFPALEQIHAISIDLPVSSGDAIIANILDTGADIIATCDLELR